MRPRWIFITGLMGAGKSTIGARLAQCLGWRFIDLDQRVVEREGRTIAALFEDGGESTFRQAEREALEAVLAQADAPPTQADPGVNAPGVVLALGGGTYVQDGVPDRLRPLGPTVYLKVPPAQLAQRVRHDMSSPLRPLLAEPALQGSQARLEELLRHRQARYQQADVTVAPGAQDDPVHTCRAVLEALVSRPEGLDGFDALGVALDARSYPIWIGQGGAAQAAALTRLALETLAPRPDKVTLVTDERVGDLYNGTLLERLRDGADWALEAVVVPEGEGSKSVAQWNEVMGAMLRAGMTRRSVVLALGGGVVGDLAGFAAAALLRGVRLIQIPTTLLAQVDSSVGGKTGINHPLGKNLIGAFHQPQAVIAALGMLKTLDARQRASGLGEVVKYALLDDESDMLSTLEGDAERIVTRPWQVGALIARCCQLKAQIVARDELERSGARALLNLGHTFGHAVEAMGQWSRVTHGESVGLGTLMAVRAAAAEGLVREADAHRLETRLRRVMTRLGLPTELGEWLRQPDAMSAWMGRDKKVRADRVTLILPRGPGDVVQHPVPLARLPDLVRAIARLGPPDYPI